MSSAVVSALEDERRRLTRWSEAFAAIDGWAPRLDDLDRDGAFTITFEPRVHPIEMLGGNGHFRHRPALVAHLERMGFGWDGAGRVLTAPSPESFNRLANTMLPRGTGYRTTTFVDDGHVLPLGPWLRAYLAGRIPIHLGSSALHDAIVAARVADVERGALRFQLESLAHDLTVHALNYQLVPRTAIDAMAARIRDALPERVASWSGPGAAGPLTLATFFDNDLNRYCYAVWSQSENVAGFSATFLAHLPQLLGCLDQRIEETRRGLGDVPSGRTRDLVALAPWEFDIGMRAATARDDGSSVRGHVAFRDPEPLDERARELQVAIARTLVNAPRLPVDLPAFGLRLIDVTADRKSISLRVGHEQPIAALRLTGRRSQDTALVTLGRGAPAAVNVVVEPLHDTARRFERALASMAERLARAITAPRWDEARQHARELTALPAGVRMHYFRQLVPGVQEPTGLIRTGFRCNQDCGICWQSRDWGGFDAEQIVRWIDDLTAAGVRSLIVSGGEPTLDPELERYLRHARAHGARSITLETNAIQLGRGDLAARLRDAGLTTAFVSLHSADPVVSDAITRAPGTHARTVRGIHALLEAGVTVKLNAVMTAEGLDHLAELPDFLHQEFGHHRALLGSLMLSYPTDPFDPSLNPTIVPEPTKLRGVLRQTLDRAFAVGLVPEGLDGPCGPPLCAFGADPRVASLAPIPEALPFRRYLPSCDGCAVRTACFGCRTADVALYGDACAQPLAAAPARRA